jgi:hypothetical protein
MKRKAQISRAKNQEKIKIGGVKTKKKQRPWVEKNSEEIMKASQKARDQRQRAGVRKTREKPDSQSLAKSLALAIARLFPESFTVFGERIAVRNDAGTEATRAMVRADLEALEKKRGNKKKSETV